MAARQRLNALFRMCTTCSRTNPGMARETSHTFHNASTSQSVAFSRGARTGPLQSFGNRNLQTARGFASEASSPIGKGGPIGWQSLALLMVTGGGLVFYFDYEKKRRKTAVVELPSIGVAALGGPFELVDSRNGKKFTDKDLLGQYALLYFGFTHCPDICPDELLKIAEAVDLVEKTSGEKIQPVFISLDPERDNVAQVRAYVTEFHPRLIGLTGAKEACVAAAKAYRVYFTKANQTEEDYLIDHSIIHYLIDPEGAFVGFYGKNMDANAIGKSITDQVQKWKKDGKAIG
mmetsp:Transcript_6143/g.10662  ORF Transcript_6143/g.10662 Transcript_6143/m.10662 type:complete len:290 (+) Transcript_6143:155-1024(+)